MKDMKVTFSDTERDFSSWVVEKNRNALLSLCSLIREQPQIVNSDSFLDALDNTLKIFALANGNLDGIYCDKVFSLLLHYDIDGYYFLEDLIYNKKSGRLMKEIMKSEPNEEILSLIEKNDKEKRQELAVLLAQAEQSNPWIQKVAEDLEYVHNGEKKWEWFYGLHFNDRNTFQPYFKDTFIQEVYEYFHSEEYENKDL